MTDPTSLPNFPQPAAENPLRDTVIDVLQGEGFRPEVDGDGDVSFKIEGQQLFVHCTEGELPVVRVFGQWQIADNLPSDPLTQLRAANDLSLRLNIVKAGINGGTLVVTCEHIVHPGADVRQLIQLSYQLVLTAVQMWHQLMLGEDVFGDGSGRAAQNGEAGPVAPGQG
ncbi:hypothetical protein BJY21_000729 [Kineosphaera limosa]|uniref:TY-Chap central domain-containing protein n=1 Tax=Kineosphaera limosa NBRC 100340 TaxID=1184609 RepID=K6XA42_9MICO|nr:hypothetical protein [Kineosphaera limosa]NYD99544.1 hypothetical protein [Kineosphaera limosa]GAB95699.1 hypothetical protein KILIM_025_00360 [Kineosphaera limosa NBRC 100340]